MFNYILFKDKSDLTQEDIDKYFPGAVLVGQMEKLKSSYPDVTILSVKSSKVGKTAFERFPNLKWIINRAHGVDNINLDLCRERNVGVIATYYTSQNCADWIISKIKSTDELGDFLLFGCGHIGKKVKQWLDDTNKISYVVTSKSQTARPKSIKTIVFTVPLLDSTRNILCKSTLDNIDNDNLIVISISRAETTDNIYLLEAIKSGKVAKAYVDTLGTELRDELLATEKVIYTQHTAWSYGNINTQKVLIDLKELVLGCANDNPNQSNIVLGRKL